MLALSRNNALPLVVAKLTKLKQVITYLQVFFVFKYQRMALQLALAYLVAKVGLVSIYIIRGSTNRKIQNQFSRCDISAHLCLPVNV